MARDVDEVDTPLSTRRLEAFTDGVFAIAATLLVLDLTVDKLGLVGKQQAGHGPTNDEVWQGLLGMSGTFLSFVLSFLLLGLFWSLHVRQFEYVVRVDGRMLWLNIVRLLAVVLIPFSTSMNSAFGDQLLIGRLLLPVNFLFVTVMGAWQWVYASKPKRGLMQGLSAGGIRIGCLRSYAAVAISVIVVALAPFLGSWAFFAFALNPLTDRITSRMVGPPTDRGRPAGRA